MSIRILHLLSPGADFQSTRTQQLLQREAGADFVIERQCIGPSFRQALANWRALRKQPQRSAGNFDLVHAFGTPALTAAALAGYPRILFSPPPSLTARSVRWIVAVQGYRDVQMICGSALQQRQAIGRGVPLERCHLIHPAVEFSRVQGRRRDPELRRRLGIATDDVVLLAPGESTRAAAHELAVWTCGILHVLEPRYRLLLWGRGPAVDVANTLARRLHQPKMTIDASAVLLQPVDFESLLPVADTALVTAAGAVATLPIAQTMAAALPIVAVTNRVTTELLEDRHTALLVTHPTPRLLAQRTLDLLQDTNLAWSLGEMARTEAFEYFSASRMLNAYRTVYRQMSQGERVEIPTTASGPGMLFHSRA